VVWGNEHDPGVLRQWYDQFYPGVTLTFRGGDRIQRRVVVLSYDPVNPANPAERLSGHLGTADVFAHSQRIADAIRAASGLMADYQIVETHRIDEFPVKRDGFRYSWDGYLACHANVANCHSPDDASYLPILNGEDAGTDLCGRIASGEIDEVWIWGFGWFSFDEFAYKIPNDQPLFQPGRQLLDLRRAEEGCAGLRTDVLRHGLQPRATGGAGLHSFGHRMESALTASPVGRGLWRAAARRSTARATGPTSPASSGTRRDGPAAATSLPASNSRLRLREPTPVTSQCDDWFNYPTARARRRPSATRPGDVPLGLR
jgi:hypothetical protein